MNFVVNVQKDANGNVSNVTIADTATGRETSYPINNMPKTKINGMVNGAVTSIYSHAQILGKPARYLALGIPFPFKSKETTLVEYTGTDTKVTVPYGITDIGNTFTGNSSITEVILPDSVHTINNYAFANCTALEKISLPKSLKTISNYAFQNCISLRAVDIPDSVEKILYGAFEDCRSLEKVRLGNDLRKIEDRVFYGTSLQSLQIPDGVAEIGDAIYDDPNALSNSHINIIGAFGSAAEYFAEEHGFAFNGVDLYQRISQVSQTAP